VTGYNGLTGPPPLDRTELYELWWRQSLFADRLIVRLGKSVPTYDFGNVARPVPVQDPSLMIPATSGLIYTPLFVNPTILGALPGYYNSAYGITATASPSRRLYISVGMYDGNLARGVQTGAEAGPTFNGYRFQIGEVGTAWLLGAYNLPGSFAVGIWDQSGALSLSTPQATITQNGTHGGYGFGSQRCGAKKLGPAAYLHLCNSVQMIRELCLRPDTLGSASLRSGSSPGGPKIRLALGLRGPG
jgi:porin